MFSVLTHPVVILQDPGPPTPSQMARQKYQLTEHSDVKENPSLGIAERGERDTAPTNQSTIQPEQIHSS